jgi:hypothetical protein
VKLFWVPTRLQPTDLVMLWLVIVWVVYFDLLLPSRRRAQRVPRVFGPALSAPEELVLLGLAALAVSEFLVTVMRFGTFGSGLGQAKPFIYLFAGYLLLRGMLCRASRSDCIDLLTSLVVVNTIAAGLFFLHQGLHLSIYTGVIEHTTLSFQGVQLTRSFYFMPQLLSLSLAFCFAKSRWGVFWTGVVIVNLAAVWVSYTRILLVVVVVELAVVLGVRLLKRRQGGRAVRRALALGTMAVALGAIAFAALPADSHYFSSRIASTTQSGGVTGDANVQSRFGDWRHVYDAIGPESHIFGQGYASAGQAPLAGDIGSMSADLMWVPVLYRLGLLGVAGLALLYGLSAWRAMRMGLSGWDDAEFLALVLVGALVGQFLEGMTSFTILYPTRYPMGLWLFALLAGEACRRRAERTAVMSVATSTG